VSPPLAPPRREPVDLVDVGPARERDDAAPKTPPPPPPPPPASPASPPERSESKPKPAIFVPERPPDDPGVAQTDTDESPNSIERLRTAQIR
jgi:hypothetical protein